MVIRNTADSRSYSNQYAPISECFSDSRASLAVRRLSKLTAYGKHYFQLYAASNPCPFFLKAVTVTRNYLKSSTRNNTKSGSIYNNWSLPTLFQEGDRREMVRVPDVLTKLFLSEF